MATPNSESAWLVLLDDASKADLDACVSLVEKFKEATIAEPCSLRIWMRYCDYLSSLIDSTTPNSSIEGWPEEEISLAKELFSQETIAEVWQAGLEATKYRINDSHVLWNKYIRREIDASNDVQRIKGLFLERLQVPQSGWDETSQLFSNYLTTHDEANYEATMMDAVRLAKRGKELYSLRESHEMRLQQAVDTGEELSIQSVLAEYLEWESLQSRKKASDVRLCYGLYERALVLFGSIPSLWEDFVSVINQTLNRTTNGSTNGSQSNQPDILSVLDRATKHCPWSGSLWSLYLLQAEVEAVGPEEMQQILDNAAVPGRLDRDGMSDVFTTYSAWCGYLRRRTLLDDATEESMDEASNALSLALVDVQTWGDSRLDEKKVSQPDPNFSLERSMIDFQSQQGRLDSARIIWKQLVKTHGDSWEFWQQYYEWEMAVDHEDPRRPSATAVLKQGANRRTLDWPEKLIQMYERHCSTYQGAEGLMGAKFLVHRNLKELAVRRQREAFDAAQAAMILDPLATGPGDAVPTTTVLQEASSTGEEVITGIVAATAKRKRDSPEISTNKRARQTDTEEQHAQTLKRDRENTSVLVSNLPAGVTQTKIKQFFREYGRVINLAIKNEADDSSATAIVEFRSAEEALSALLKNDKLCGENQIKVVSGSGLTLYVTNYPPAADEDYIRALFKDCGEVFSIRWPSLKYNTKRRFCYISFTSTEATQKATSTIDGQLLDGQYKIEVRYSEPGKKKAREEPTKRDALASDPLPNATTRKTPEQVNPDIERAPAHQRIIQLYGVPDTMNEARVKTLVQPYGEVLKVVLIPRLNLAKIEFEDAAMAGKAALSLHKLTDGDVTYSVNEPPPPTKRAPWMPQVAVLRPPVKRKPRK